MLFRSILNKETPEDNENNNRYTRANSFLQESLANGTLLKDNESALYEYIQKFEHPLNPQQIVERRTLFVALKLEPYEKGVVLPHEETHPKAKADRLLLMKATQANPEPIYGLYEDPNLEIAKLLDSARGDSEPFLKAVYAGETAEDAEQHLIYRHNNPEIIRKIQALFEPKRVWIADGHHRYETALNYQKENPKADALLIGLSAFEDKGLVVLPTHRMVKNVSASRMLELPLQLERYFHLRVLSIEEGRAWIKQEVVGEKRFVIILPQKAYALTLRDIGIMEKASEGDHCQAWRHLDVSILQFLVLDRSLGISWQALAHTPDVAYTRDEEEAVQKVANGEFQLSCMLQNPTVTEVRDVASAGDKMPQKSTFFYPKLWSGLILRFVGE